MLERQLIDPPRSKLYSLAPEGLGSPWVESLTSYVNRLAWTYRVGPRVLVAQEVASCLNRSYHFQSSVDLLAAFCRSEAISINGAGESALDWADTLGRLTMQEELLDLTASSWAGEVPAKGFLRASPAWCPSCYLSWQMNGLPVYQPLLWMLQAVTICTLHCRRLEERCPQCQKTQSVIGAAFRPGFCTQCVAWLGAPSSAEIDAALDHETRDWQQWVFGTVEELRTAAVASGMFPWKQLIVGLEACIEVNGDAKRLASLTGVPEQLLSKWRHRKQTPSFDSILELCYVLEISPVQLVNLDPLALKEALLARETHRQPRFRSVTLNSVNRARARELIQSVLDGRHFPIGVRQIERCLGLGSRTLIYHFAEECALISARFQAYRAEKAQLRVTQGCEEVRQATITLHGRQVNPSAHQVASLLSNPGMMRSREGLIAWHEARRELGLEW